jgi:hypothetical protein
MTGGLMRFVGAVGVLVLTTLLASFAGQHVGSRFLVT